LIEGEYTQTAEENHLVTLLRHSAVIVITRLNCTWTVEWAQRLKSMHTVGR